MHSVRNWAIVSIAILANAMASAQPNDRPSMATLLSHVQGVTYYEETAISPNHRDLAWVQSVTKTDLRAAGSAIYVQALGSKSAARPISDQDRLADQTHTENSLAWSPDSSSLAFLSDAESPGQTELYVLTVANRSLRRLTSLKGTIATPRWSPDGRYVALLFTENADRLAGPLVAVPAPTGVIQDQILEQALVLVDVESGGTERLTAADRYVYEFDWSPQGDSIVATGAHGSGDNNWYNAELFVLDIVSHSERVLLKPPHPSGPGDRPRAYTGKATGSTCKDGSFCRRTLIQDAPIQ
jgi:Tol biopolymer transport system component